MAIHNISNSANNNLNILYQKELVSRFSAKTLTSKEPQVVVFETGFAVDVADYVYRYPTTSQHDTQPSKDVRINNTEIF